MWTANLQLWFLISSVVYVIFQGNNIICQGAPDKFFDPFSLFKPRDSVIILKTNCAQLCNECDGVATLNQDVCKCQILSDYPMQCLERIQRKAESLGLKVLPKSPPRTKRCLGGGTTGFPAPMFGIGLSRTGNNQLTEMGEQMVGQPTESLNALTGMITAPLMEQIKAIFGGDTEMAKDTLPGQMLANFPKVLSTFTSLLDTFNVAAPTPKQFVGAGKDSDGENPTGDFSADIISSLPMVNQLRAVFIGDPNTGSVDYTLPVQFAKSVPVMVNSLAEMFSSLGNAGAMASRAPVSNHVPADKSWLYEDDDDDDDDDSNKNNNVDVNQSGNLEQKIIVSPFRTNNPVKLPESIPVLELTENSQSMSIPQDINSGNIDYNSMNTFSNQNMDDTFKRYMTASGLSHVIKPEETVIIINPTAELSKSFMANT